MRLININKEKLNGYLAKQKQSQFLQSFEWGEFQEAVGNKVFRFGIEDEGVLIGAITLIKKSLFLGLGYLYVPRVGISDFRFPISDLFMEIKKIAKREKCIFLRYEPLLIINQKSKIINYKSLDVQPSKTLILDIEKSEEEILKQMHPKTRYNIRLAERNGVRVETLQCNVSTTNDAKETFEEFWKIMEETNERDGFRLHGKEYYWKMLYAQHETGNMQQATHSTQHAAQNTQQASIVIPAQAGIQGGAHQMLNEDLIIKLLVAKYQNKIIAGNIVAFFGDMATYVHGASANERRNLMAPYALQWEAIKMAKDRGCKYYDFYGIDEKKWPGVTRFKKGYGGEEVDYPGTFDIVFALPWYRMYNGLRWVRRKLK